MPPVEALIRAAFCWAGAFIVTIYQLNPISPD